MMLIDNNVVERARNTDIIAFFESHRGFTFTHKGGAYRCEQHPSLAIKHDRKSWFWHSKGVGGFGVLDYLIRIENMPFGGAIEAVTGFAPVSALSLRGMDKPKTLVLPEKSGTPLRLYDYLCGKRGIDSGIVETLIQEKKLYEDKRGNVVFVSYDEYGNARFATLRGTHDRVFRMDCAGSDKRYGFNLALSSSARLYVYESAIDAMSHGSIENMVSGDTDAWRIHNRLSLAGTSDTALSFFLNKHKQVNEIVFCLDNDPAGREAADDMAMDYADRGFDTRIELPMSKDYNEDLLNIDKHAPTAERKTADRGDR